MSNQKDNTFVLFKNDKGENEKAPDFKGKITIAGKEYDLAAWAKESEKGTKYLWGTKKEPFKKQQA